LYHITNKNINSFFELGDLRHFLFGGGRAHQRGALDFGFDF
jgi:hypothetical protein